MSRTADEVMMDPRLRIEVSRDHFTAYLHVRNSVREGELALDDIKRVLEARKIVYGVKEDEKLSVFLDNLDLYDRTLILASGRQFTQGTNAEIKFLFEADARAVMEDDLRSLNSVDFRRVGTIASVRKGDIIARKSPATQGEEGFTVFGQRLPGEWGLDMTLQAGENVSTSADGMDFIADISGAPIISKGFIRIDPTKIIDGDVNFSTGNIDFDGTVAIRGCVLDGFSVKARGDVIVDAVVEAATIEAGGDVVVRRGILTRGKTMVKAEGSIYAKFIENSIVESEGDVVVENAILNSEVRSNSSVVALSNEGSIIGGQILAFDRVVAKNIGSYAHVATYVQAGYRYDVQKQYIDALAKLRSIQKQMTEVKKNYDYVSGTSGDFDTLGELRGKAMKFLKLQKQMQEDITEINNGRVFNQFSAVEVENTMYPGSQVYIGDARYAINKDTTFASIKWDSEDKSIFLTTFDETGRGTSTKPSKRAKTVLIIDDSRAVRKTLKMILEKSGLRVVDEADDGRAGVQKFKEWRPSLVTLDISMVNMDGIAALGEIMKINPKARVIMISSNRDKKKVLDCVMKGAADYILKPFVPKRVVTVVKTTLEK